MEYDIVICGGGLVGRSLACALAKLPLQIAVIEAQSFATTHQADFDTRSFALSYGNSLVLERIGIWQYLADKVTPIKTIHVSDKGHFGITRLQADEQNVPALGYIALAPELNQALQKALLANTHVQVICPAKALGISFSEQHALISLDNQQQLKAKLVVAADGSNSMLRQLLDIPVSHYDYGQTAIIANLGLKRSHNHTAYERFSPKGPMALLPLSEQRMGLVWTLNPSEVGRAMALDDQQFLAEFQASFGYRLGKFTRIGKRFAYPLQLLQAQQLIKSRVALVGNAAHTLHPIAGQGFNLGLRDVATLAKVLSQAQTMQQDIGSDLVLTRYARLQAKDHRHYIQFTDGLVKLFANTNGPLVTARNAGLNALNLFPQLKKAFTRRALGFMG